MATSYSKSGAEFAGFLSESSHEDIRADPNTDVVSVQRANVTYGDRKILNDVSWRVKNGENWAVTGPNGSGKSTLVSLLFGTNTQVYCNDVTVLGRRLGGLGVSDSIWEYRKPIGMVTPYLHLEMQNRPFSTWAVVCSGLFDSVGLWQTPSPEQTEDVISWLRFFCLEHLKTRPFTSLSQGEQRTALLARAMVKRPKLLLLDEPTHGLDAAQRGRFLDWVETIGSGGSCSVVCVTHHRDELVPCITNELRLSSAGTVNSCGPRL